MLISLFSIVTLIMLLGAYERPARYELVLADIKNRSVIGDVLQKYEVVSFEDRVKAEKKWR